MSAGYDVGMRTRRITLELDEDVVEALEGVLEPRRSAVANDALRRALSEEIEAKASNDYSLRDWFDELDVKYGAATPEQRAKNRAFLDMLERGDSPARCTSMSSSRVVLDATAFDVLGTKRGDDLRDLLSDAFERRGEVCCAAVTLAEVCRGPARTRGVEAALARRYGNGRIRVVPTDERLAKLVGAILHDTGSGSERLADAHVVAVCAGADNATVLTGDPEDIVALAVAVPGTRIMLRNPDRVSKRR